MADISFLITVPGNTAEAISRMAADMGVSADQYVREAMANVLWFQGLVSHTDAHNDVTATPAK